MNQPPAPQTDSPLAQTKTFRRKETIQAVRLPLGSNPFNFRLKSDAIAMLQPGDYMVEFGKEDFRVMNAKVFEDQWMEDVATIPFQVTPADPNRPLLKDGRMQIYKYKPKCPSGHEKVKLLRTKNGFPIYWCADCNKNYEAEYVEI